MMRILIAEDVPTDAKLVEFEIKRELGDCTFLRVETETDFLNALADVRPDIIVSDYSMPAFDGMTALKLAVAHVPDVPFIMVTGSMNEETAVECMKAGAWDYVIKGHIRRLGPAVVNALQRRALILSRRRDREKSAYLNGVLRTIGNVNKLIIKEKRPGKLIRSACDALTETPGNLGAWIALLDEAGMVEAAAETGIGKTFSGIREKVIQGKNRPAPKMHWPDRV
jgi:CheY-like chemotaxis protein